MVELSQPAAPPLPRLGAMVNTIFPARVLSGAELSRFVTVGREAGIGSYWVGDHLNWYVPALECLTTLAFLAGTTDATLGTNVLVAPLRQPYLVAKMAASIAHLAPGGMVLGLGVGGEHPAEFAALDVDHHGRGARTDEAIDLIRRLLSEEMVDHNGTFFRASQARISPRPEALPILVGGRSEPAFRRVVQRGDGWTAAWVTARQFGRMWSRILDIAGEAERVTRLSSAVHVFTCLQLHNENAWDVARAALGGLYATDATPFERFCVTGPAEQVAERLDEYYEAGVDQLIVSFLDPDPVRQIECFTECVAPLLEVGSGIRREAATPAPSGVAARRR